MRSQARKARRIDGAVGAHARHSVAWIGFSLAVARDAVSRLRQALCSCEDGVEFTVGPVHAHGEKKDGEKKQCVEWSLHCDLKFQPAPERRERRSTCDEYRPDHEGDKRQTVPPHG